MNTQKYKYQGGQTLVLLLVFTAMAIAVTTTGAALLITNLRSTTRSVSGSEAYIVAESAVENALMQLLRNPNYAGESLTIGDGTATITVGGSDPKVITAVGQAEGFQRTIQVQVSDTLGMMEVISWQEIY